METIANALLTTIIIAFVFMGISGYCVFMIIRIARKSFLLVYNNDKSLYKQILDGRKSSWIERRTDSIKDISLWGKLYRLRPAGKFYTRKQ